MSLKQPETKDSTNDRFNNGFYRSSWDLRK